MSLNTVTLSPARTPTPLQDEVDIRHVDAIEYTITLPSKKLEGKGKIFLTDLRLILVADVPTDGFETLAAPHTALLSVKAEAPRLNLFSPPRIVVEVKPSPGGGGGLGDAPARVEFRLVRGGDKDAFHSFAGALDKTRERAVNRSRANPEDEFDLREWPPSPPPLLPTPSRCVVSAYGGPGPSSSSTATTTYVTADAPSDAPPGYEP
ncbi:hypothetical protein GSI_01208 [Ganoderma sinense ZZ0214-1]|uniref:Uncharacterized protein n=1 Tax=Ganoderma sinense ZZ0214-1 TaxID=1077348 RepID=A0A2G8SUT4_9APHY|nr:hypothetical protein GSI_01208 [Ganoderma sinense ZZ0214-1]